MLREKKNLRLETYKKRGQINKNIFTRVGASEILLAIIVEAHLLLEVLTYGSVAYGLFFFVWGKAAKWECNKSLKM